MTNLKTPAYLLFWFVFVGIFAYLIPYFSNDFRYMMVEGTNDVVQSISDIFVSQYRHYFSWGGRTPPHVLAQFLLYKGKWAGALATALCYVGLIYLIYVQGFGKKVSVFNLKLSVIAFISLMIWMCLRAYGEVTYLLVSACNYLFTTTFIFALLLPYTRDISKTKDRGFIFGIMMLLLGVIAGWCNENTGFAICVSTFFLCVYFLYKKKLKLWQVLGLAGMGIGFIILVLSPGNKVRLQMMESEGTFDYYAHIFIAFRIFLICLAQNTIVLVALLYLLFVSYKNKLIKEHKDDFVIPLYLFLTGFLSLAIMVFSPNFPARSSAPFTFFTISSVVSLYFVLKKYEICFINKKVAIALFTVGFAYFALTAANAWGALFTLKQDMVYREASIKEQLDNNVKDLVVEPLTVRSSRYIFLGDVRVKKTYFANEIVARYLHVDSITRTCDDVKIAPHSDFIILQNYGKKNCSTENR